MNDVLRQTRIQQICDEIIDCAEGRIAAEFYGALVLAAGVYLKAAFPTDLEGAYRIHGDNLRAILEDLDARPLRESFADGFLSS